MSDKKVKAVKGPKLADPLVATIDVASQEMIKRAQELAKSQPGTMAAPGAPAATPTQAAQQQGGGFLAGAAQTALGVAGGIVVADLAIGAIDELAYGDIADEMAENAVAPIATATGRNVEEIMGGLTGLLKAGTIGALLIPEVDTTSRAFNEKGQVLFPLEVERK